MYNVPTEQNKQNKIIKQSEFIRIDRRVRRYEFNVLQLREFDRFGFSGDARVVNLQECGEQAKQKRAINRHKFSRSANTVTRCAQNQRFAFADFGLSI